MIGLPMLETLGRYVLIRRIAAGGMGAVYLARQTGIAGFDRPCVVKVMHSDVAASPAATDLFLDEARVTARLTHAHIAQVYDFGKFDNVFFLAMEWVDGPSLSQVLKHFADGGRRLPLELAARIVSHAAQGLDYAHRLRGADGAPLQLVHRDVSPQNILVSREGTVKVIDFGIAKARITTRRTGFGLVRGKVAYMAPEQMDGAAVDARTDVFALGLVLYELITGRRAVTGRNEVDMMLMSRSRQWPPVQQMRVDCPEALAAIVERAIADAPSARYATMAELSNALEELLATQRWLAPPAALANLAQEVLGPGAPGGQVAVPPPPGLGDDVVTDAGSKVEEMMQAPAKSGDDLSMKPTIESLMPVEVPEARRTAPTVAARPVRMVESGSSPAATLPDPPTLATPPEDLRPTKPMRRLPSGVALVLAGAAAAVVAGTVLGTVIGHLNRAPGVAPTQEPAVTTPAAVAVAVPAEAPATSPPPAAVVVEPSPSPPPSPRPATAEAPATGALDVVTDPPMEIFVDGHAWGRAPKLLKLAAGTHRVVLSAPGQQLLKEQRLVIAPHATQRLEWRPQKAMLEVRAVPPHVEMSIRVDGVDQGTTPLPPLSVWEGEHVVSASTASGWSTSKKISVEPGSSVSLRIHDGAGINVVGK
jgi:serine/threonine-protein kinase